MKRIGNSKEPTIQRMLDMTSNLNSKFKCHCAIDLNTMTYHHSGRPSHRFYFYIELRSGESINTWSEVLARYRELMND